MPVIKKTHSNYKYNAYIRLRFNNPYLTYGTLLWGSSHVTHALNINIVEKGN